MLQTIASALIQKPLNIRVDLLVIWPALFLLTVLEVAPCEVVLSASPQVHVEAHPVEGLDART